MKALTLTQPWATLVAIGAKKVETRSWLTTYRGPLAIHSAGRIPRKVIQWLLENYEGQLMAQALKRSGYRKASELPLGKIICVSSLERIDPTELLADAYFMTKQERAFGDYSPGRYGWMLGNVLALPEPIPCRGAQRLWTVPPGIEARLKGA